MIFSWPFDMSKGMHGYKHSITAIRESLGATFANRKLIQKQFSGIWCWSRSVQVNFERGDRMAFMICHFVTNPRGVPHSGISGSCEARGGRRWSPREGSPKSSSRELLLLRTPRRYDLRSLVNQLGKAHDSSVGCSMILT